MNGNILNVGRADAHIPAHAYLEKVTFERSFKQHRHKGFMPPNIFCRSIFVSLCVNAALMNDLEHLRASALLASLPARLNGFHTQCGFSAYFQGASVRYCLTTMFTSLSSLLMQSVQGPLWQICASFFLSG